MKKISLIILTSLVFFGFCFFYFQPSKAQNKSSSMNLVINQPMFFPKQTDNLKPVPQMVKNTKSAGVKFERRELFQSVTKSVLNDAQLSKVVSDGVIFNLNKSAVQKILKENVEFLTLPLPNGEGGTIELELTKVNIFAHGFSVITSKPTNEPIDENLGIHYRGIVKGNERSLVAISIFKNEVMGFYSTEADGNYTLGRLRGSNKENKHILYSNRDLKVRQDFYCDTKDSGVTLPESILQQPEEVMARCVRIYIESNYDLFIAAGSVSNVVSYLTGMFNQSATLFSNEGISVSISQLFVWNAPSPYSGRDSVEQLRLFQATRTSFNGDLAHLISLEDDFGGIAAGFELCNRSNAYAFSGIKPNYEVAPTFSWTVGVFTHEIGHNLGSRHTHACVWNGNNTAIDGCQLPLEGSCSNPGLPVGGGTIMSYCDNTPVGINFSFGFGPQPSNLIASRFNNATCLTDCGGGGCSTTPISVGQTINSSLTNSDCAYTNSNRRYDDYVFNGTVGQQIAISMNSTFDNYLYLLNSSNQIIKEDDDGAGGTNSRIPANSGFFTLPATGTYTIRATSFNAGETGAYTLSLTSNCSYSLNQMSQSFSAAGGSGSVNITAGAGCAWNASSNFSWITANAAGTGSAAIPFSVAANTGPARIGTITIAGQTLTVNQAGSCSYSLSSASANVGNTGGNAGVNVSAGEGCAWNAVSNNSWITISSGGSGTGNRTVSFSVTANSGQSRTGTMTIAGQTFTINQAAAVINTRRAFDFDGDGKADISVFRPSNGVWYLNQSQNGFTGAQFGISTDKVVSADYDGDGKTDLAVYRNGIWYLQRSTAGFTGYSFGDATDIPQPADFDGDGKAELAVYRPSNGVWYVFNLVTNQFTFAQFGAPTDLPVVGDYDGDGRANFAVFRPSNGFWYIARPTGIPSQNFDSIQLGTTGDKPVAADYDGDGKTDVAVFRPSNGTWYLQRSRDGFTGIQFGISTDLPVAADYDGDGRADVAVYRSGVWYLNRTTAGFTGVQFGATTDKPVPNAFVP